MTRQHAVRDAAIRVLQQADEIDIARDQEQALPEERIEVAKPLRRVVREQDRERERQRDGVRDREERLLQAVGHTPGRVREGDVRVQDVAELPDEEEDCERERVVAVAKLAGEEREARRHHQRAEPVARPAEPGDEACHQERPGGDDGGNRSARRRERFRQVVDLNLIGQNAEYDARDCQERQGDPHRPLAHLVRIVTDRSRGFHRADPGAKTRVNPERSPKQARCPESPIGPSLGA